MVQTIEIMLENINLMIGVNKSIFKTSFKDYGILAEECWIQHLWENSQKYGLEIHGQYITPTTNRMNGYALMEKIMESDIYNDDDIISINKCRVYLQVQNLSDIANGKGTKFHTVPEIISMIWKKLQTTNGQTRQNLQNWIIKHGMMPYYTYCLDQKHLT